MTDDTFRLRECIALLEAKVRDCEKHNEILKQSELRLLKEVRDLTRPIDGTFVLSAEPTKEEISQARQVIGQLQREVRDLTGERDKFKLWANCGGVETDRVCACPTELGHKIFGPHVQTAPSEFWCEFHHFHKVIAGLRDNVERLERDNKILSRICCDPTEGDALDAK